MKKNEDDVTQVNLERILDTKNSYKSILIHLRL